MISTDVIDLTHELERTNLQISTDEKERDKADIIKSQANEAFRSKTICLYFENFYFH